MPTPQSPRAIFAGDDPRTYPHAARDAAQHLRETINRVLDDRVLGWAAPPRSP